MQSSTTYGDYDGHASNVETVATAIAAAVGSPVFGPLHDTAESHEVRDRFRELAEHVIEQASALTL
jgi:hypothetical protein